MGITTSRHEPAVAVVTIDFPPVNALPVQGWFDLADAVVTAGRDAHAVVVRAEGRGFCAGVDLKEIQAGDGHAALVGANRGCAAAFAAVYECAVPVIVAVHGHCLGGGIGLIGNADVVVASDDARFGVPEVDRGALGAASHLGRLVPRHLMRALYFTARTVDADLLARFGSVFDVVARDRLDAVALELAEEIARKDTRVIRAAKEAINGLDGRDVRRDYRYEQGFTFELNLLGVADTARQAFLDGRDHAG